MPVLSKKITYLLSIVCCVCWSDVVCGDNIHSRTHKQSITLNWGAGLPSGDSFIDKTSVVNPSLEWSYRILPVLSAGVSAGYGINSVEGIGDEYFDTDLISGYREKRLSLLPLLLRLDYFPLGNGNALLNPYIGIGAGMQHAGFHITGDFINTSSSGGWAGCYSARVGVRVCPPAAKRLFFNAGCAWSYGGNNWPTVKVSSLQSLDIAIGAGVSF